MIQEQDNGAWIFETSPGNVFHLCFLPGTIALYGGGHFQYFSNPDNLGLKEWPKLFPDDAAVMGRAEIGRVGRADKGHFLARVRESTSLSATQKATLSRFILDCDCTPAVIREKLRSMGYSHYVEVLVHERPSAEMEVSIGLVHYVAQLVKDGDIRYA